MSIAEKVVEAMTNPETVVWAAIRLPNGKVLRGTTHGNIRRNMSRQYDEQEEGFLTSRGRFITREQAYSQGVKSGQITPGSYARSYADMWGGPEQKHVGIDALAFNMAKKKRKP